MSHTDADKLETLAEYFDIQDAKNGIEGNDVQEDLRRMATSIRGHWPNGDIPRPHDRRRV
jgi:hypothetical protein